MQRFRPARVLLVEDNLDDIEITRRALKSKRMTRDLLVARDGQEAVDLLFQAHAGADGASEWPPDLTLLDINLPKVNGFDVLRQIRSSDKLSTMPVVVLTASAREEDVHQSYLLGANSYIQKPAVFEQFLETLGLLGTYWFEAVTLPSIAPAEEAQP